MQSMMSYKLTCAYFIIGSLCLLKVFDDQEITAKLPFTRTQIIDWVYSFQIGTTQNLKIDDELSKSELYSPFSEHKYFGFRGDMFYQ